MNQALLIRLYINSEKRSYSKSKSRIISKSHMINENYFVTSNLIDLGELIQKFIKNNTDINKSEK
jgi:hypothetical protein